MRKLVILGAGVSGLSAAYHASAAVPNCKITVIEASDKAGGLCGTYPLPEKMQAHLFGVEALYDVDYGIHTLFTDKAFAKNIYDKLNPVEQARRAQILFNDCIVDYPFQANISQLPPLIRDELVRRWKEPPKPDGTFVGGFAATYGKCASDMFFYPYNRKKFGAGTDVVAADYGKRKHITYSPQEIDSVAKEPANTAGHCPSVIYPTGKNISALPEFFVNAIPGDVIHYGYKAVAVDTQRRIVWVVDSTTGGCLAPVHYDVLVTTVPNTFDAFHGSSRHISPLFTLEDELFANVVAGVSPPFAAIVVPTKHVLNTSHWLLIPGMEHRLVRLANINAIRGVTDAPCTLFVAELVSPGTLPRTGEQDFRPLILELVSLGVIDKLVGMEHVFYYSGPTYPIYSSDARVAIDKKVLELKRDGIWCIGRFGRWAYLDSDECIIEGANAIVEAFK